MYWSSMHHIRRPRIGGAFVKYGWNGSISHSLVIMAIRPKLILVHEFEIISSRGLILERELFVKDPLRVHEFKNPGELESFMATTSGSCWGFYGKTKLHKKLYPHLKDL